MYVFAKIKIMKEFELINIIKTITNSSFIGDDCAYLKDLSIVVTQDSLVENIHFKLEFTTPFQLGFKSVMVNLSDIYASGAEAKYLTISLSLPKKLDKNFVEDFYKGAKKACNNAVQIIGGDITGSEKLFISVCAIGSTNTRKISSRKNAKKGFKIITNGKAGSSAAGLSLLLNNNKTPKNLIVSHLMPNPNDILSKEIATKITKDYVMMDTSDGLIDALYKIAKASNVLMSVDMDKIPFDEELKTFKNYQDLILFGAEDYNLVAVVPEEILSELSDYTLIGEVKEKVDENLIEVKMAKKTILFDEFSIEQKLFDHFN